MSWLRPFLFGLFFGFCIGLLPWVKVYLERKKVQREIAEKRKKEIVQ